MSNVLNEDQKQKILALGRLHWPLSEIERQTGIRRETASKYLKAAGIAVRGRGQRRNRVPGEAASGETAKPAFAVSPDSAPAPPTRSPTASACEVYRELIEQDLAKGRNAKAIWQDLVDRHGFPGQYQSVKRFVRQLGARTPEPRAVIVTAPGEEAQVDYGDGPMVRHPVSGKYRRTRLFVLTLGYSRKSIRLLVWKSSSQQWAELHERAFRRLGGTPKVIVLDNLKEGVLAPEYYDPAMNPLYRDLLQHYGCVALPCRVQDPDRKGKVERGVGHARNTPLKGQRFESLEQAQAYLDNWETKWADTRIHGTTKRQVLAMFLEEKPALQPLPLEPFRFYQYGERTVHLDGCVEVEAAYYSAPPRWIGRRVSVQWDSGRVRILDPGTGQLLREHWRSARGRHHLHAEDQPRRTPQSTVQLLGRAGKISASVGTFCQALHEHKGPVAIRQIQGVLGMAKKHGTAALDRACSLALSTGCVQYHFLRRYFEHQAPFPHDLQQVDPLIRDLTAYREVIAARLRDQETEPHEPGEL